MLSRGKWEGVNSVTPGVSVSVTIIMPVRNEARYIRRSLGSVLSQDYPHGRMEILIVDGISDDGTREIVSDFKYQVAACESDESSVGEGDQEIPKSQTAIRILDNPACITPAALNVGLRHARGEIIILVGGHCEIAPDYVRRCIEVLHQTGADCVGGPIAAVGETPVAQAVALAQSSPFGTGGVAFRTGSKRQGYVDTVAFGAYHREVFDRVGGFDEEMLYTEDDEFNFRLVQTGGKIWLDPSIRSIYYSRTSLCELWRQYFQYGFRKVRLIQKRGAVPSWRHLVPGAFVLSLLGSLLLALLTGQVLWVLAVAGPYVIVNGLASLWSGRYAWSTLPILPLVFLILHLAYGLGFLWGVWHWQGYGILNLGAR